MISYIWQDLKTKSLFIFGQATAKIILRVLFMDGTMSTILFRLGHWLTEHKLGFLALVVAKLNSFLTGATLGSYAKIGPGFIIVHSTGVVIHNSVRADKNLVVQHQVTIGVSHGKAPVLGSNICIGAGAKVLGGVYIGDNVRVGANAVVVNDIPEGATAVGIPAKVVKITPQWALPAEPRHWLM